MYVFFCRTYILRGSSPRLLSLMWPALGSWSLRSPRITEHLSSGLKVTVWLYFPTCTHMHACLLCMWFLSECDWTAVLILFLHVHSVERSEWVVALENCIRLKHQPNTISSSLIPHFQGYLEHRGLRSKIYTIVISDKVFLYKSIEVRCIFVFLHSWALYDIDLC